MVNPIKAMRDKTIQKLAAAHKAGGGPVHDKLSDELRRKANMLTAAKLAGPTVLVGGTVAGGVYVYRKKRNHSATVHEVGI